jgi:hypothetical protein
LQIDNFNWKKHIEHIIQHLSLTLIAMRIVASFMTTDISKLVTTVLFIQLCLMQSHFWGYSTEGKKLFTTVNKVIRIMASAHKREMSGSLFKQVSTQTNLSGNTYNHYCL